ncbi:hypothetical protein AB0M29_11860 [Streptomyces sp. NPDC051976]|uniref:hypothetical protein n=1 Tax=Streptomyces sp. NPDC051976 TaxID=3154947 RepID=UPI0034205FD4
MALAGLLTVAACGGHSGPPQPPTPGQARVLGQTADGDIGPFDGTRGVAADAGGALYVNTGQRLVRLGTDGTFTDASGQQGGRPGPSGRGLSGLVARGDGSLLTGEDGQVVAVAGDGRITELAGTAGRFRSLTAPVPRTAAAAGFRFAPGVTPLGVGKDGTVVIADGNVVWSLSGGTLTRRYEQAPVKHAATYVSPFVATQSAADPDGTVFLAPVYPGTLGGVTVVPGNGQPPHKLALPARVPDLGVATADLATSSLTGDGADGVYADVSPPDSGHSFVIHVHGAQVDVIASTTAKAGWSATCEAHKPAPARGFPCPFPLALTYRSGHVYLAGQRTYVLDIAAAAS